MIFSTASISCRTSSTANVDNRGTVRPRHRRNFAGGLYDMIIENGVSRVFLGVHWVFDAFAVRGQKRAPDLTRTENGLDIGGVPLGLVIAEDIFDAGDGRAPKKSDVPPRSTAQAAASFAVKAQVYEPASPKQ